MKTKLLTMPIKLIKVLAIILLSYSSFAWTAASVSTKKDKSIASFYTQDETNIVVEQKHPEFVIKLKSNPTTGYAWFLREYNSKLIVPIAHRYEAADTKLVGASGFEYWTFRMRAEAFSVPQQTQIRLIYSRPWAAIENTTQAVFRISTMADRSQLSP